MELDVFTIGRNHTYDAKGVFDGQNLRVLKGSKIACKTAKKINPIVERLRSNPQIVSTEFVLLEDVTFKSASTAASFVTGNISNGMRVWKQSNGKTLGEHKTAK